MVDVELTTLAGDPLPWVTWMYSIDGGNDILTNHTEEAGVYTVTVPENDGSYASLELTVTVYNSSGNASDTVTVTVGT